MIRFLSSLAARHLGKLGGRRRALNERERYLAKAREIREQCGLPDDERLAA